MVFFVLDHQIDLKLYLRQAENTKKLTNFSKSLPFTSSNSAIEMVKDPYIFELAGLSDKFAEKELEAAIVEKIKFVLLELGKGFLFVGNQYRISTEGKDYYLNLLFYHIELRYEGGPYFGRPKIPTESELWLSLPKETRM